MGQENVIEASEIHKRALTVLRSGDIAAADSLRSEALWSLDDSSPLLHAVIAIFHFKSGRLLDAIDSTRKAAALCSSCHVDSAISNTLVLIQEGRILDATTNFHRALRYLCNFANLTLQRYEDEEEAYLNGVVSPRKQENAAIVRPIRGLTRYTRKKLSDLTITQQQQKEATQNDAKEIRLSNLTHHLQELTSGDEKEGEESGAQRKEAQVKAQVREFLEYQIRNKQLRFLTIDIDEFKTLLADPAVENAAKNHILKALEIPGSSFTLLLCCSCGAKFIDPGSLISHLDATHFPERAIDSRAIPGQLSRSNADEIVSLSMWKPVDVEATLEVLDKFPERTDPIQSSGDSERTRLVAEISESLRVLMERQCLTPRHVNTVAMIATNDVHHDPRLLKYGAHAESLRSVCFASASELTQILRYISVLQEAHTTSSSADDSYPSEDDGGEGRPIVSHQGKSVLLNLKSIPGQDGYDINVNAVVDWLYSVSEKTNSIPSAFLEWTSLKDGRRSMCVKFLVSLRRVLKLLQDDCNSKLEKELQWSASGAILHICKRRAQSKTDTRSYKVILQEKLLDGKIDEVERETIASVLMMVEGHIREGKFQESSDSVSILTAVQELRLMLDAELGVLDVKIRMHLRRIHRLKDHIVRASSLDYIPIVLPSLRMLLQMKIEADAKRFAEKSVDMST